MGKMKKQKKSLFEIYHALAVKHSLAYPEGRALYMVSRHWNGGLGRYGLNGTPWYGKRFPKSLRARRVAALKTIQDVTAKRWAVHYFVDGSPKALKYTNRDWNYYRSTSRYDTKQNNPTILH